MSKMEVEAFTEIARKICDVLDRYSTDLAFAMLIFNPVENDGNQNFVSNIHPKIAMQEMKHVLSLYEEDPNFVDEGVKLNESNH